MAGPKIVYTDMCADLYHYGHVRFLKQCREAYPDAVLLVGVHSDKTIEGYKRKPIMKMAERIEVVESCKYVDRVIEDAPIIISAEFMEKHQLDMVCYAGEATVSENHAEPKRQGKFRLLNRTEGISTTEIIDRLIKSAEMKETEQIKKEWKKELKKEAMLLFSKVGFFMAILGVLVYKSRDFNNGSIRGPP